MKKRERYKLLTYAKKQYSEAFKTDYQFKHLSKKYLHNLLKEYKHSSMCDWSYCCRGLYQNCWQELYTEGNWDLTQEDVNEIIKETIDVTAKACRRDSRILCCETDDRVDVIIVTRDIFSCDSLITFTNKTIY
jgi:hypothetical protein